MKLIHDDISERLARKCLETPDEPTEFYFVSRRHWIELVPELVIAIVYGSPIIYLFSQNLTNQVIAITSGLLLLVLLMGFGFELYRWDNDLVYLTQYGLARRRFTKALEWQNFRQTLVSDTGTIRPFYFTWAGINAGTLVSAAVSARPLIPLIPNVQKLHARIYSVPHIVNVQTRTEANRPDWAFQSAWTQFESKQGEQ